MELSRLCQFTTRKSFSKVYLPSPWAIPPLYFLAVLSAQRIRYFLGGFRHLQRKKLLEETTHFYILPAQILGGFRLSGSGRPSRSSAQVHPERLRQRDVAAVGEGRDDETLLDAQVLVAVLEVDVSNGDDDACKNEIGRGQLVWRLEIAKWIRNFG